MPSLPIPGRRGALLSALLLFLALPALIRPAAGQTDSPGASAAAPAGTLPDSWVKALNWRSLGPAAMGGRVTAISVFEADPTTYWVATGGGGLLKTVNNGITFEHQFDKESTVAIGDVCVSPSDRNIVWLGTGENNPRNSVSYGDGVYKSTDGGKTWKNMGLRGSYQIGRVMVHPKDPNVVYVGALGRLWGRNKERGLYKTTDGGQTWQQVLFVDDRTGVIDLAMHPQDPETLLVATWERLRDGFDSHRGDPPVEDGYDPYDPVKKWGPGSGVWKTTDGGKTFRRLTQGLPSAPMGRIGLDAYRKNGNTVFAIIDSQKYGMGTPPSRAYMGIVGADAEGGAQLTQITPEGPAAKAGLKTGDLVLAVDGSPVRRYNDLLARIRGRKEGEKVALRIRREGMEQDVTVTLEDRPLVTPGPNALPSLLRALVEDVEGGVKITRILPEGAAEKAKLAEGDVIRAVEETPVTNGRALLDLLNRRKQGDKVKISILRGKDTRTVTLEIDAPGQGSRTRPWAESLASQPANIQDQQGPDGHEYGGVYRSDDAGETWRRINSLNPRPMYFSQVRVDPSDDTYVYVLGVQLFRSKDGGKTFTPDGGSRVHADQHALWINPRDGRHMIAGTDGGFYVTHDRMERWDHLNHLSLAQFYHVAVDNRRPYRVYGGLQDNGSWGGPSQTLTAAGPLNEDWINVAGADGFVCRVDPDDPDLVYYEAQNGGMGRRNLRTGERAAIRPKAVPGMRFRFNWNTPFILSNHNGKIFYTAGNYVFRSLNRGDELKVISPEIARTGRGTGTAVSESPLNPDVLWVGTDDGNLWLTRDGGEKWTNLAEKLPLPGPRWVATIEASRFAEGRAYVAFDAHRSDDDEPYVLVTEDFGRTWKSLRANLPVGSTRCLREDVKNPNLLYLGTEFALWASLNRGASWTKLNGVLPTVAVHEVAVHPTAGEIVAATHGRGLWVLDVTALRQMTPAALSAPVHLYEPNTLVRWRTEPTRGSVFSSGHRRFIGENPGRSAQIYFSTAQKPEKASLRVLDIEGKTLRELPIKPGTGLQVLEWDGMPAPAPRRTGGGPAEQVGPVPPGTYRLVLTVDGQEYGRTLRIERDPNLPPDVNAPDGGPLPEEALEQARKQGRTPGD